METLLTNRTAPNVQFNNEKNGKPSETVPDQAISANELLRRFATGQPLGFKNVEAVYDSEHPTTVPEFYKMSKLDRLHALQENHENVQDLSNEVKHYQKSEAEKAEALKNQQESQAKSEGVKKDEPAKDA